MVDIRQTKEYANYLQKQGWLVERVNNTNYFIKKLPLIGSVLKIQRPNDIDFKTIHKLEEKYKTFQTIIEPNLASGFRTVSFNDHSLLLAQGFKLSKSPYLPSKTIWIDLTQSISKITADFKKHTRQTIKRGGVLRVKEYFSINDLKKFHNAWKNSVKFSRFVPPLENLINLSGSFIHNKPIILASHNICNDIIGGAVFTRSNKDFSYYWYGFTNKEGRTSLSQYSLLYQGILWAKKMSYKILDLEGIYDSRFPNKSWLGFSHFKRSFGGKEVEFPGCYTKFRLPFLSR